MAPVVEVRYRVEERPAKRVGRRRPPVLATVPRESLGYRLVAQILAIIAVLSLSFLVELTVLGNLRHDRDQAHLAAQFRVELAKGTAPVGPLDDMNAPLAIGTPVALLEIPRLKLRQVVVEGTSSTALMSGPGHRRDTPLPGQVGASVVAGRRATYGAVFWSINQLRAGDEIIVTTGQGRSSLAVLGVRHAGDLVPPALARGRGRLTLVTTDGPALVPTSVLFVDAEVTSAALSRPAQLASRELGPAEAMMAGDSSALLGAFLWSVLLAAAATAAVWFRFQAGMWPAWALALPVLVALDLLAVDDIAALLPNLL